MPGHSEAALAWLSWPAGPACPERPQVAPKSCGCPIGHHRVMSSSSSAAEISSLTSTLQEQRQRVTAMIDSALERGDEDMARELIAVERSLGGALRRLQRYEKASKR